MSATLTLLSAGAAVLTLAEVKAHLRIDHDDDDELIKALIDVAQGQLEGVQGTLGRALLSQRWRLTLPWFVSWQWQNQRPAQRRHDEILLPLPPTISVESVKYLNPSDGTTLVTMATSDYRLIQRGTDVSSLFPAVNSCWPSPACDPAAVRIEFTAGYNGNGMIPGKVPDDLKHALKLFIGHLYINREAVNDGRSNIQYITPMGFDALIARHRVNWY